MESIDLTSVIHSIYPFPPVLRTRFTRVTLFGGEKPSYVTYDNSEDDSSGPRCRRLPQEAYEESREGVAMVWSPIVVVGQKMK